MFSFDPHKSCQHIILSVLEDVGLGSLSGHMTNMSKKQCEKIKQHEIKGMNGRKHTIVVLFVGDVVIHE